MNIKIKFILFLVLLCFLHSCTKKEFEGPSIETLYGDFEVIDLLKLTNKNPNFSSNEQVGFHCEFNKPVEWKIAIVGLSTNATRQITGFSNIIDKTFPIKTNSIRPSVNSLGLTEIPTSLLLISKNGIRSLVSNL